MMLPLLVSASPRSVAALRVKKDVVEGIEAEVLEFDDTVESVEKASVLSGYPPSMIVKTLLVRISGKGYVVVLARGDRRLNLDKLSEALGGKAGLARPSEVREVLGAEVGAVTPLSQAVKKHQVIADPAIMQNEYVLCGGGSLHRLYKVKAKDLVSYLSPTIIDVFI
jgi:Cys-tRNA(Pro)/Cys-tRNA(Cys) deacylase